MEKKLATYTEPGTRLQLIEITKIINETIPLVIIEKMEGYLIQWSNGKMLATTREEGINTIKRYKMKYNEDKEEYREATLPIIKYYQIRKNRKRLCSYKWETPARQKFNALIQQELLQTKMQL